MNLDHLTAETDERRIAGACVAWPDVSLSMDLDPSQMASPVLRDIVTEAARISSAGGTVDVVSIAREMSGTTKDALIFLVELQSEACVPVAVDHHCQRIRQAYSRRQAHSAANRLRIALEAGDDVGAASAASDAIGAVSGAHNASSGPVTLGDAAEAAYNKAEAARLSGEPPGIQTSIGSLNRVTGGLRDQRLYIIAARPSHGKSALAMQLVIDAGRVGKRVLVFSLEMGAESLATREIARLSGVNSQRMDRGQHSETDTPKIISAVEQMHGLPIWIDDRPGLTAREVEQACRVHQARHGLDMIAIDYSQLLRPERGLVGEGAIADTVTRVDALKKTFNCPVVLLVQPNKACDSRPDRRPTMGDMHGSSIFEKCANVMIIIYRAARYADNRGADPLEAEGIIAKNREGTCGVLPWRWNGPRQTFADANPDFQH